MFSCVWDENAFPSWNVGTIFFCQWSQFLKCCCVCVFSGLVAPGRFSPKFPIVFRSCVHGKLVHLLCTEGKNQTHVYTHHCDSQALARAKSIALEEPCCEMCQHKRCTVEKKENAWNGFDAPIARRTGKLRALQHFSTKLVDQFLGGNSGRLPSCDWFTCVRWHAERGSHSSSTFGSPSLCPPPPKKNEMRRCIILLLDSCPQETENSETIFGLLPRKQKACRFFLRSRNATESPFLLGKNLVFSFPLFAPTFSEIVGVCRFGFCPSWIPYPVV